MAVIKLDRNELNKNIIPQLGKEKGNIGKISKSISMLKVPNDFKYKNEIKKYAADMDSVRLKMGSATETIKKFIFKYEQAENLNKALLIGAIKLKMDLSHNHSKSDSNCLSDNDLAASYTMADWGYKIANGIVNTGALMAGGWKTLNPTNAKEYIETSAQIVVNTIDTVAEMCGEVAEAVSDIEKEKGKLPITAGKLTMGTTTMLTLGLVEPEKAGALANAFITGSTSSKIDLENEAAWGDMVQEIVPPNNNLEAVDEAVTMEKQIEIKKVFTAEMEEIDKKIKAVLIRIESDKSLEELLKKIDELLNKEKIEDISTQEIVEYVEEYFDKVKLDYSEGIITEKEYREREELVYHILEKVYVILIQMENSLTIDIDNELYPITWILYSNEEKIQILKEAIEQKCSIEDTIEYKKLKEEKEIDITIIEQLQKREYKD